MRSRHIGVVCAALSLVLFLWSLRGPLLPMLALYLMGGWLILR